MIESEDTVFVGINEKGERIYKVTKPCPKCYGTGHIRGKDCFFCRGTGVMEYIQIVPVNEKKKKVFENVIEENEVDDIVRQLSPEKYNSYLLTKYGIGENGKIWRYMVASDTSINYIKTHYNVFYNPVYGWYSSSPIENPDFFEIDLTEYFVRESNGALIEKRNEDGIGVGILINEAKFKRHINRLMKSSVNLFSENDAEHTFDGHINNLLVTVVRYDEEEEYNVMADKDITMYTYTLKGENGQMYSWRTQTTTYHKILKIGEKFYLRCSQVAAYNAGLKEIWVQHCKFSKTPFTTIIKEFKRS